MDIREPCEAYAHGSHGSHGYFSLRLIVTVESLEFNVAQKWTSVSHAKHRQIREIGEIRVRIKQRKIHMKKYSGYYFPSVSGPTANLVFKKIIRGQKRYAYCDNSL